MRKQELIHVHGLLAAVAEYCEDDVNVELEKYRSMNTRSTSINHSKTSHKEAVFALSEGISQPLESEPVDGSRAIPSAE